MSNDLNVYDRLLVVGRTLIYYIKDYKCTINFRVSWLKISLDQSKALLMDTLKEKEKQMVKADLMPFLGRKWTNRDKYMAGFFFIMHTICIIAPFQFNLNAFWVAVVLHIITGCIGINISYHRNLSHRSFRLPKWLEYLFAYCGTLAFQV